MPELNSAAAVLVVGGGHLARCIVEGAVRTRALAPTQIHVVDRHEEKRAAFAALGVAVSGTAAESSAWFLARSSKAQILLAVKPQSFRSTVAELEPLFELPRVTVISVLAGITSQAIRAAAGSAAAVIRVMTNTPSQVGRGMSAVCRGAGSHDGDERLALTLFSAVGAAVQLAEDQLDAFMALAASGPAYLLYIAEALASAAEDRGLPRDIAELAARETLIGTGLWMANEAATAAELRRRVATPGGVTAAALAVFDAADLRSTFGRAIRANLDRCLEIGRLNALSTSNTYNKAG